MQFQVIREVIGHDKLIQKVAKVGAHLRKEVEDVASKKSGITGVRGVGTQLFVDTQNEQTAYKLHSHLLHQGVISKLNGSRGVAFKPALIFDEKHVDEVSQALNRF